MILYDRYYIDFCFVILHYTILSFFYHTLYYIYMYYITGVARIKEQN